jgi:biopolymer transport protein ExbB
MMLSNIAKSLTAGLLALTLASAAYSESTKTTASGKATPVEKVASLDELLKLVQAGRTHDSRDNKKRETLFKKSRSQQANMLKAANNEMRRQENISAQLEKEYEKNDEKIAVKSDTLQKRLGNLKELFGHLTGSAGDLRTVMSTSVISAQYTGRTESIDSLIATMSSNVDLPTIEEVEQLWVNMQHEMTQSGRVQSFNTQVILPAGETADQTVVRIGSFNLVSDGKYLTYDGKTGNVSELGRQPSGSFLSAIKDLEASTSGVVQVGIDPTGPSGGSFLQALINSPSIIERWHQGGLVGYIISFVGLIAFTLAIWRFVILNAVTKKVLAQSKDTTAHDDNPLGRIMAIYNANANTDNETLEMKLAEGILKERPKIEAYLPILKIISMVAPLLGLLGTVTGMIITFQAITIFGAGDPKAMAGGISGALVTTVLGLLVAIPTVLLHSIVNSKAKLVTTILEEQSTGIVAEQSSKAA